MTSDQTPEQLLDTMIGTAIHGAMHDVELSMTLTDSDRGVETESMVALCRKITEQLPAVEADLKARFPGEGGENPDHFLPEAVMSLVQVAWNYGFRAGRIFEVRGYHIPGEDQPT